MYESENAVANSWHFELGTRRNRKPDHSAGHGLCLPNGTLIDALLAGHALAQDERQTVSKKGTAMILAN